MKMHFMHSMLKGAGRAVRMVVRDSASRAKERRVEDLQTQLRAINERNRKFWAGQAAQVDANITEGESQWQQQ